MSLNQMFIKFLSVENFNPKRSMSTSPAFSMLQLLGAYSFFALDDS
jgi:hypothetical protein